MWKMLLEISKIQIKFIVWQRLPMYRSWWTRMWFSHHWSLWILQAVGNLFWILDILEILFLKLFLGHKFCSFVFFGGMCAWTIHLWFFGQTFLKIWDTFINFLKKKFQDRKNETLLEHVLYRSSNSGIGNVILFDQKTSTLISIFFVSVLPYHETLWVLPNLHQRCFPKHLVSWLTPWTRKKKSIGCQQYVDG